MGDLAIQHYEVALADTERMDARPVQARIQGDMARPIARRGDSARAAHLEHGGERLAESIGGHL